MKNFASAHNSYLEPPDDDPVCENGCGETLVRDWSDGEWFCDNKFCPTKFQGVEKEMAEALVEYMDSLSYKQRKNDQLQFKLGVLRENLTFLVQWLDDNKSTLDGEFDMDLLLEEPRQALKLS